MAYRTDREALELRRAALVSELEGLARQREALAELDRAEEAARRKLADTERLLGKFAPRPSLLDNVRVASPCPADWAEMAGDERVRFCGHCAKNVFNLSAMPAPEAEQLLRESTEGSICIRVHRRADGTVLTEDCPVGAKKKRIRRLALATVGGGLMAGAGLLAAHLEQRTMDTVAYAPLTLPERKAPPPPPSAKPDVQPPHTMGIAAFPRAPTVEHSRPEQGPKPAKRP